MNARATSRSLGTILALTLMLWGCGDQTSTPTAPDTIEAQFAKGGRGGGGGAGDPVVESVLPDEGLQGQTLDIEVGGKGFEPGDEVALGLDGNPVDAVTTNGTTFVGSGVLEANITIAEGADIGDYDVIVMAARGRKGIGTALFKVKLGPHQNATATDLGSVEGRSMATDINEAGDIVGWSYSPSGRRAVFWDASAHQIVDLGLTSAWAEAINNSGQIVGHYWPLPDAWHAFVLSPGGVLDDLPPFAGDNTTMARDINDAGEVVGESTLGASGSPTGFIWNANDGMKPLMGLPGGSGSSRPFRVNSEGHVVGVSWDGSGSTQAVIWLDTGWPPIALTAGADYAYAYGVSDPVDGIVYVAGQRGVSGDYRSTLWTVQVSDGSFTLVDLASSSYAWDVNTKGEVVGDIGPSKRAYLWRVSGGAVETVELGALTGRSTSSAVAMNEAGQMVGFSQVTTTGKNKGLEHAVLWQLP